MTHPDFLRSPENAFRPDQRSEGVSVFAETGFRPKQLEDQHTAVARFVLHEDVPEGIRVQFETTKNLYLYSWFVYRFYPVAHHHAYTVLELTLRERFEDELHAEEEKKRKKKLKKREFGPGLKQLLAYAIEKGYLKNENFEDWHRHTETRARHRMLMEDISEMSRLGLTEMAGNDNLEIKDVDRDHDMLRALLKNFPWLRNHYAHGSKSLHNQVLGTLQIISEIINQIYPRHHDGDEKQG
jgi:hypothetical protein